MYSGQYLCLDTRNWWSNVHSGMLHKFTLQGMLIRLIEIRRMKRGKWEMYTQLELGNMKERQQFECGRLILKNSSWKGLCMDWFKVVRVLFSGRMLWTWQEAPIWRHTHSSTFFHILAPSIWTLFQVSQWDLHGRRCLSPEPSFTTPGSTNRAPIKRDAPFPGPSFHCLSQFPVNGPPPQVPQWDPTERDPVYRNFYTPSPENSSFPQSPQ
jgi:hypothetical protein